MPVATQKQTYKSKFQTACNRERAKSRLDRLIKTYIFLLHGQPERLAVFWRLLLHAQANSTLIQPYRQGIDYSHRAKTYLRALVRLSTFHKNFLRPIEAWQGGAGSAHDLFHALFQHLLAQYDTPRFFDSVWTQSSNHPEMERYRQHIGIAQGKNIRELNPPIRMTRRMAHFFLQAPDHFSYIEAMRFGQLKSMRAEHRLLDEVVKSRLGRNLQNEDFWETVLRFLVYHQDKGLRLEDIGPIIDFIQHVKFHREGIHTETAIRRQPPRDPGFSLKGRSLRTLMRMVSAWHAQVQRLRNGRNLYWRKSPFMDFEFEVRTQDPENPVFHWSIRELLDSNALYREGRSLRHCVGLYDRECHHGRTTIWSLARVCEGKRRRRLTIELNPHNRRVVQIRGRCNRMPKTWELEIIKEWAKRNKLVV